jgi:two-component system sensor histidine kinase MprB
VNLRARLALWLGILAAAAAIAVAFTGYRATAGRLQAELDDTLETYGHRIGGGDNRFAANLCQSAAAQSGNPFEAGGFRGNRYNPLLATPGAIVQCINDGGQVVAQATDGGLPVSDADRQRAEGQVATALLRTTYATSGDRVRMITVPVPGGAVQLARPTSENDHVLGSLRIRYLTLVAVITALAAAAGWAIARRTAGPVLALTYVVESIAADGGLDTEVPTSGSDEIGRLSRSFSSMLDALRRSRDQQQRLVQDAGHELRTPLTSLRTNVDTLRRHPELSGPQRDELLSDLDSELRELSSLTNELVGLAAEPGGDEPATNFNLADLAGRAADRTRRRTGHPVTVESSPAPMVGQVRQISRLIDNLLDNAAKFSPPGATIELVAHPGLLAVSDQGPGIAEGDLPHVFERFYRSTAARSTPGSGLGLSIVEDIAIRHQASVTAMNLPTGGAGFVVRFPIPDP